MSRMLAVVLVTALALAVTLSGGCDDDTRVAGTAERAAERQAELDKEMAQLNRQVAEGSKELVAADARSREALLEIQQDLQSQQTDVNRQRDELEKERKHIADQRLRESILAPILASIGPLAVCGLVLLFCCMLVFGMRRDRADGDAVGEILVEELTSARPMLLPPPATPTEIKHDGPGPAAILDCPDCHTEPPGAE